MRFHNVDLHVAVIEDVRDFLAGLGHTIDVHNLSGHSWTLGRPQRMSYGPIRASRWEKDIRRRSLAPRFWLAARGFRGYDGGLTTHVPSLGLAYRFMRKPLVSVLSTRYEAPFSSSPAEWGTLTEFFLDRHLRGVSHFVANNLYDRAYFEYFTGIRPEVIPSVCAYVDRHVSTPWSSGHDLVLIFGEPAVARACASAIPTAHFVRDRFSRYAHDDVVRVRAHVVFPYNASVMSFFEHYWLGIPQFAPTPRFLIALHRDGRALSQLSSTGFTPSPVARRGGALSDPNDGRNVEAWLPLHDIYVLPFVTLFDSFDELKHLLDSLDGSAVSSQMRAFNQRRQGEAKAAWARAMERVALPPRDRRA